MQAKFSSLPGSRQQLHESTLNFRQIQDKTDPNFFCKSGEKFLDPHFMYAAHILVSITGKAHSIQQAPSAVACLCWTCCTPTFVQIAWRGSTFAVACLRWTCCTPTFVQVAWRGSTFAVACLRWTCCTPTFVQTAWRGSTETRPPPCVCSEGKHMHTNSHALRACMHNCVQAHLIHPRRRLSVCS